MNSNNPYNNSIPLYPNQIQNIQTINNPLINNQNYNNYYGNTPLNTVPSSQLNLKSAYSNSTLNVGTINKKNSSQIFRQLSASNKNIIERNKLQLPSSGTLMTSTKSRKFNKVLKNGKKIGNIDINNDSEDAYNEDLESVSTNSITRKKTFNNTRIKNTSLSVDLNNNTQNKINAISGPTLPFNGNPLNTTPTVVRPMPTIESLNPFARFVNKILDMINPEINKKFYEVQPEQTIPNIEQPEQSSAYSKVTPNKFSQNTISTTESNNEIIQKTNNNLNANNNNNSLDNKNLYNNIQKITVVDKSPTKSISNNKIEQNLNINNNNKLVNNINNGNNYNNNNISNKKKSI
jgi:hypothetical protein